MLMLTFSDLFLAECLQITMGKK